MGSEDPVNGYDNITGAYTYGTGKSVKKPEGNLKRNKSECLAEGTRAERGTRPPGIHGAKSEGGAGGERKKVPPHKDTVNTPWFEDSMSMEPGAYQEKYPEKTVHEDWDKANSPGRVFEAAVKYADRALLLQRGR